VNHWSFEEGTGTTTADVVGGKTGTFSPANASGPTWELADLPPVPSGSSAAIAFDGTGDQIDVNGYKGITGSSARTMTAWIKTADTTAIQNRPIISWGDNSRTEKWNFRVQAQNGTNGAIRVEVNGGYIVGNAVVTDGEWHHVAATFEDDGSPNVRDVLLYVDGVLDADFGSGTTEPSASLSRGVNTDSDKIVEIGRDHSDRLWKGLIDDVRIYDEALDAGAIAALALDQGDPIPEPCTLLLASLAVAGLGGYVRRRRRATC
jgi:hypothetical protein